MNLVRVLRHLISPPWMVGRAFSAGTMQAIEAAIKESESGHQGEIRFAVEAALEIAPLLKNQAAGERQVDIGGVAIPVNLPGRFVAAPGSRHCILMGNGLVAQCRIGNGHVLLVADAALLEREHDPLVSGRGAALDWLVARLAKAG